MYPHFFGISSTFLLASHMAFSNPSKHIPSYLPFSRIHYTIFAHKLSIYTSQNHDRLRLIAFVLGGNTRPARLRSPIPTGTLSKKTRHERRGYDRAPACSSLLFVCIAYIHNFIKRAFYEKTSQATQRTPVFLSRFIAYAHIIMNARACVRVIDYYLII